MKNKTLSILQEDFNKRMDFITKNTSFNELRYKVYKETISYFLEIITAQDISEKDKLQEIATKCIQMLN